MTRNDRQGLAGASMTGGEGVMVDRRPEPLSFPSTLAGTWPAPDPSGLNALQQVQALDAVKTSLTSLCPHALRSMPSWQSVRAIISGGWAESQGRMDPIARMSRKVKDFVNSPAMAQVGLSNTMTRFKP